GAPRSPTTPAVNIVKRSCTEKCDSCSGRVRCSADGRRRERGDAVAPAAMRLRCVIGRFADELEFDRVSEIRPIVYECMELAVLSDRKSTRLNSSHVKI